MIDHDDDCTCFKCKLKTIQFGNVTPPPERLMEQQRAKDLPAYKRLRDQGLQPKRTTGCAELETRATDQFEIDFHGLVSDRLKKTHVPVIKEAMQMAQESTWSPIDEVHKRREQAAAVQ